MDRENNHKTKTISNFFTAYWGLGIIFPILVSILFISASPNILTRYISDIFRQIPYIGGFVLSYLKSLNLVDIQFFATNVFKPIIGIDTIYFALMFITFQIIIIFLKRYIMKHENAILSSLIVIVLLITLFIRAKYILPITHITSVESVNTVINVMKGYLALELILFITLLHNLSSVGQYDIKSIWTKEQASKYTRNGLRVSIAIFTIVSIGLFSAQALVNTAKNEFHIAYKIEFIPGENNKVNIKVPQEISKPLALAGIKLPEELDENSILNQLGIDSVDIGEIVNNTIDTTTDNLTYNFIQRPLAKALSGLTISLLVFIVSVVVMKRNFNSIIIQLLETILLSILFFNIGTHIGNIISVVTGLTLIGSLNNTFIYLKEGHYNSKGISKLKALTSKLHTEDI